MQAYCEGICIYLAIHKPTPKFLPLYTFILIELEMAICKALAVLKDAEAPKLLSCLSFHNHPFQ